MKIYGNAGQAITCENEQTFAGFATRSERDIVADLERRHTVTSPIKLAPLDPKAEKALISRRPKQAPRKPERPAKLPAPRKRTRATTPTAQRQKVARPASGDGQPTKRRRAPQKRWIAVDLELLISRYRDGQSAPQLATQFGIAPARVRRLLDQAGIERRDDRAGHSGGTPKSYEASLVSTVRRLYGAGFSQLEVAIYCKTTTKVIQRLMDRHDIERRPAIARPQNRGDHAQDHRNLVASLGGAHVIRDWARRYGVYCPAVGLPSAAVVDAYLDRDNAEPREPSLREVAQRMIRDQKAEAV
jgi:hypothetical protein